MPCRRTGIALGIWLGVLPVSRRGCLRARRESRHSRPACWWRLQNAGVRVRDVYFFGSSIGIWAPAWKWVWIEISVWFSSSFWGWKKRNGPEDLKPYKSEIPVKLKSYNIYRTSLGLYAFGLRPCFIVTVKGVNKMFYRQLVNLPEKPTENINKTKSKGNCVLVDLIQYFRKS